MTGTWLPLDQYIRTLPKSTAYACLYLTDEEGRPLQLKSSLYEGVWQMPGGNLETGEMPWQAAVRETREETGITVARPGPLLLAHFLLPDATWPLSRFGLVFDGGTLSTGELDAITLDAHEHCEWDVRSLQEWEKELHPASFACLAAVDRARRTGTAGYLDRHT